MAFGGIIRQSTSVDVLIGPFLDETTGKDTEEGLTIEDEHVLLSKNGQGLTAKTDANDAAHDANGYYNCPLDTTDTNTVGQLTVTCHMTGALPIRLDFQVMDTVPYDELFKDAAVGMQGVIEVNNLDHLLKVTTGVAADGDLSNHVVDQTVMSHLLTATADTDKFKASTDSLEAIKVHADTIKAETALIVADTNELQVDNIPGLIGTAQADLDTITGTAGVLIATDAQDLSGSLDVNTKTITAGIIANASFNADVGSTAHGTNIIALACRKILEELNLDHLLKVDTTVAADGDLEDYVVGGTVMAHLLAASADATDFKASTDSLEAIKVHNDTVKAETALIVADTNELQGDWTNAGRLDALLDAIKVVTDNMAAAATTLIEGTVSWDNSNATTTNVWSDDVANANADFYNGRLMLFTSGALVGQATDITDYEQDAGEGKFTITAVTAAPADDTTFVIV